MKPLISASELLALLQEPQSSLVIIDARAGTANARELYEAQHLRGARFVSLEDELAQKSDTAANGGRHPLPPVEKFAALLGLLGITPETRVVVYDDKNGANAAARFWWMLRSVGHESVQVLDGGLQAALEAGVPFDAERVAPVPCSPYNASKWHLPLKHINDVALAASDADHIIVDVRDSKRYLGIHEPIDLIAGHIPGAVNIPFSVNMDEQGRFLAPEELQAKYSAAFSGVQPENVIVHCGSGVTACHTLLALAHAGIEIPALYVGSWSEWSRNPLEIATGEEV